MKSYFTVFCFLMTFLLGTSILANIIHVPADQPTIQDGINAAVNGDTVLVADSTYYENIKFKGKAITVASYFLVDSNTLHIGNTIIDGSLPTNADSGSVVYFISGEDTSSVLSGFTLTGGTGTIGILGNFMLRAGGGIYLMAGAKIEYNKIINNSLVYSDSAFGGGIGCAPQQNVNIVIRNNEITLNSISATSGWGGGMYINASGQSRIDIINNNISDNIIHANGGSTAGAGIACESYGNTLKFIIKKNTISNNQFTCTPPSAGHYGGGIHIWKAPVEIVDNRIANNSIVSNNTPVLGVGLRIALSNSASIERNIFSGNYYQGNAMKAYGGGVYFDDCSPTLENNLIVENSSTHGAGLGIYTFQGSTKSISGGIKKFYYDDKFNSIGSIRKGNYKNAKSTSLLSKPVIINNTIAQNIATISGGSIYTKYSNPIFVNSILWSDSASSGGEIMGLEILIFFIAM